MSVVIILEGAGPDHFEVTVTPFAELAACLHLLTEYGHHAEHAAWARDLVRSAPPAFRSGLGRFAPLWKALRWRGFYPKLGAPVAALPLDLFAELTAYTCVSGYHARGFAFDRVLHDPVQARVLRQAASALPAPHPALAEDLLRDAARLRADLLGFLGLCRRVFFDELWAATEPVLSQAAYRMRRRLADDGPATALLALSPSSTRLEKPARVVLDKVHHVVISPARTPLQLIPTRHGAPHLLVKDEPGLPPVVHFPVETPEIGVTLARSRMLALTDAHRVRLCRLIAREAMTTADLADRLAMTRPQVSRHLRTLRDLGLVRVERSGRYVHYGLDLSAVERIGRDVATALQY